MHPLKIVVVLLAIGLFSFFGKSAEESNSEHDAVFKHHLVSLRAPAEPLTTLLSEGGPVRTRYRTTGKAPATIEQWPALETHDWVLLNGVTGAASCPVLTQFANINAPKVALTAEQLDIVAIAGRTKPVTLWAHVPRFTQRPAGLSACLGYEYDSARGLVTIGGKPVAIMANSQPGLVPTAN